MQRTYPTADNGDETATPMQVTAHDLELVRVLGENGLTLLAFAVARELRVRQDAALPPRSCRNTAAG